MRKLFLLIALLLSATSLHAQGYNYRNIALNGAGQPLAGVSIAVCAPTATTAANVTNNIAAITLSGASPATQGFAVGGQLTVAGFTSGDTVFNGTFSVLALTNTQVIYALQAANHTATSNGTVLQEGTTVTMPCGGLVPIYTDYTLTTPAANPFTTDGLGNYYFSVAPSVLYIQTYGPSITTQFFQTTIPCVESSSCGGGGGGGVSSVGFAAPTGFTVTGSPITGSGILQFAMPVGWTTGYTLIGNGANSVTGLAPGANGTFYSMVAGLPQWVTLGTNEVNCQINYGDQSSGTPLTTGNIQPQFAQCLIPQTGTMVSVVMMVASGASTVQLGYRHSGSTTAITGVLTPASVGGITYPVVCANVSGTTQIIEGVSVSCGTLTNTALTSGDYIETIGGAADGTSEAMSIAVIFTQPGGSGGGGGSGTGQPFTISPWYDITAYGAIGDGSTDDTTAIQSAYNAADVNGGTVFFPCGGTWKFGSLTLSTPSVGWVTLMFCGTPKPTTTMSPGNNIAFEGLGGQGVTGIAPAGLQFKVVQFDLSAFVGTVPVIKVPDNNIANTFSNIGIALAPGDAFQFGDNINTGPVDITLNQVSMSVGDSSTGACIDTYAGFGLYLDNVLCSGSATTANTGILSHGTGIFSAQFITLNRRGFTIEGQPGSGVISTMNFTHIYTEGFLDPALFNVITSGGVGTEAFQIGPSIEMADNVGGGQYLINHTGDSSVVKVNISLGSMRGWQTAMLNGSNIQFQLVGESSSPTLNGVGIGAGILGGTVFGNNDNNNFGACPTFGETNVPLTICQSHVASNALSIEETTQPLGVLFAIKSSSLVNKLYMYDFSNGSPNGNWGYAWVNPAGTGANLLTGSATGSNIDTATLPDASGTICLTTTCIPTSANILCSQMPGLTGDTTSTAGSCTTTTVNINGGAPPASATVVGTNSSRQLQSTNAVTLTAFLNLFSSSLQGLVPASGGGTTNFLRADGTFAIPPGAAPAGSAGNIQTYGTSTTLAALSPTDCSAGQATTGINANGASQGCFTPYTASAFLVLTDAATVAYNVASAPNPKATVTLGGNRMLAVTNQVNGSTMLLDIVQDGTGTRTLTLSTGGTGGCTSWAVAGTGTAIVLSTNPGTTDQFIWTDHAGVCEGAVIYNIGGTSPATTGTICSGTIALGTTLIASGATGSTSTATCTGLLSTDNIELDFNASPLAVTGYASAAGGVLTIVRWPATNTINVAQQNNTGSGITPGAITMNYRVVR